MTSTYGIKRLLTEPSVRKRHCLLRYSPVSAAVQIISQGGFVVNTLFKCVSSDCDIVRVKSVSENVSMKEIVTLSQTELKRMLVLQRALEGQISTFEAALVLGLSERQVYKLKAKFQSQGPAALVHGNRGRKPVHAVPEETRQQVIQLAQTIYRGCNYTFLSELLCEREGITLSPSSVGRILKSAGIPSPRKHRPPKLHRRRHRKPQFGMLVLIDGSHHDWLEGRGPKLVLLLAVDDATSMILAALFRLTEDFEGYRRLLFDLVTRYGIPLAIYSDRHTLFFPRKRKYPLSSSCWGRFGRMVNNMTVVPPAATAGLVVAAIRVRKKKPLINPRVSF
ncbi:Transposase [Desulfofundulus thermosubterraneus DSM 16057]|uniref:Transposase n=2 Tax=Desulfofundulus TaxID=2282741 RepID=A0A1M6A7G6_9FIRM|nr:Transposase [Desulfofundulus thermosubterraneus DSM 16057]